MLIQTNPEKAKKLLKHSAQKQGQHKTLKIPILHFVRNLYVFCNIVIGLTKTDAKTVHKRAIALYVKIFIKKILSGFFKLGNCI